MIQTIYSKLAKVFKPILDLPYGDKIAHMIVFGLLSPMSLTLPRVSVISFMMFAVMVGLVWEMITHVTGISTVNLWDLVADAVGGFLVGILFYVLINIPFYASLY